MMYKDTKNQRYTQIFKELFRYMKWQVLNRSAKI